MFQYFKKLSIWVKRLFIAGTLFVPPLIWVIFWIGWNVLESIIISYIFIMPIYWLCVLIWSWVYDGFKK